MKKYEDWKKDFIYLSYPLFNNKNIADILKITPESLSAYASKNKIRKMPVVCIGDIFGKLTVINKIGNKWLCKCICGKETKVETVTLSSGHSSSCVCQRLISISKTLKNISGTWYGNFRRNAKKRNLEFKVSKEYLNELLIKQNFKCKLSNLPIYIATVRSSKKFYDSNTASLDRIDNNKGYIEGNVQFVHKHINYMKWTHTQDYFIELCRKVSENVKSS